MSLNFQTAESALIIPYYAVHAPVYVGRLLRVPKARARVPVGV